MPTASFSSLEQCEIVEVVFLAPDGEELSLPLLVDSGFTGQSGFVLSTDVERLAHAAVPASQAAGALSGMQKRVVLRWRISGLSMERLAIAILADLSPLALPTGIQGLAGLRFLRCFSRWGAEQAASGRWRFVLSTDSVSST